MGVAHEDEGDATRAEVEGLIAWLTRRADADPRVVAAWLEGWDGARAGDMYADVVLWLSCDTKDYARSLADGIGEWLGDLGPVAMVRRPEPMFGWLPQLKVVTRDGLRVDISLNHAEFARRRPAGRLLKETPGHFVEEGPSEPFSVAHKPADLVAGAEAFWLCFPLLARALARGQVTLAYCYFLELLWRAAGVIARGGNVI